MRLGASQLPHDGFVRAGGTDRGCVQLSRLARVQRQLGIGNCELCQSCKIACNDVAIGAGFDGPADWTGEEDSQMPILNLGQNHSGSGKHVLESGDGLRTDDRSDDDVGRWRRLTQVNHDEARSELLTEPGPSIGLEHGGSYDANRNRAGTIFRTVRCFSHGRPAP